MSESKTLIVSNRSVNPAGQEGLADALADLMKPRRGFEAESVGLKDLGIVNPAEVTQFYADFSEALQIFEETAAESDPEIMTSPQNRIAACLQSLLAEQGEQSPLNVPLEQGGLEVKFDKMDWWGWFKSLFKWVNREEYHPLLRPSSASPGALPNQARLAVFSDWGTNLYGAPAIADSLRKDADFDVLMHLGDVYYAGTEKEMKERFLDPWPGSAGGMSRGLNSNHDMYSGGHAYFGKVLPAFDQESSYFALQNDHWTLIALDTAYLDHQIDDRQKEWVYEVVKKAGERKVVLFSHHQLFSRFDSQGPQLAGQLSELLAARRIFGWYWGHEHRCVLYDRHPIYGLLARCIGHGGMPEKRGKLRDFPALGDPIGRHVWRDVNARHGIPKSIALDGPNEQIKDKGDKYQPHGYAVLELDGPQLTEIHYAADGRELKRAALS